MNQRDWAGVLPAITTPFTHDLAIDVPFLREHVRWLLDQGCRGIVTPGSLGEGSTLSFDEKLLIWRECVSVAGNASPVIAAIASASTAEAVTLAKEAHRAGCRGLMVLPPYVYKGSWREMKAHVGAVMHATPLSCMLYNNPIAYGTDFVPMQIAELAAEHANLHAVKESSGDVRRIIAIRALLGERLNVLVGMDDAIVEGVRMGATGWIAGLVNALPRESVQLWEWAGDPTKTREADALYAWFLPLLRMDTTYDFVQLIKLVQAEVGKVGSGGATTRPPRLLAEGAELERIRAEIRRGLPR